MGRKFNGIKKPHEKRHTILCEWCGNRRETSREDTKTCGSRCRARLNFFVSYLGYSPDGIVGPLTGQQAVDLELHRLITNEQRRRAIEAIERKSFVERRKA